jgi:hypothetical protein
MFLSARQQNFILKFPKGFFYKEIEDRYLPLIKRLPGIYENIEDYINSSVQKVQFKGFSSENVEQYINEDRVKWKQGPRIGNTMEKSFTVSFKLYESYINYWILYEQFILFHNFENKDEFLPDINLFFMDNTGHLTLSFKFQQILFNEITELTLTHEFYSGSIPDLQNFDCVFNFNYFNIESFITKDKLFKKYGLGQ